MSYEASHRNRHGMKLFITHTWTDDRDLRAIATFKETEAHAALSSSSNSGISSSWHSIGALTAPLFCLYDLNSAYSPMADKAIKRILCVQGEGLAERTPTNAMEFANIKGLAAALATSCFNTKNRTLAYVICIGNCFVF